MVKSRNTYTVPEIRAIKRYTFDDMTQERHENNVFS